MRETKVHFCEECVREYVRGILGRKCGRFSGFGFDGFGVGGFGKVVIY